MRIGSWERSLMQATGVDGHLISPPRTLAQVPHAPRAMEIKERGLTSTFSPKSFRLQRFSALWHFPSRASHPTRSGSAYWRTCAFATIASTITKSFIDPSRRMTRENGRAVVNFIYRDLTSFFSLAAQPTAQQPVPLFQPVPFAITPL